MDAQPSEAAQEAKRAWSDVRVLLPPNTAGPSRLPPPPENDPKPTPAELKQAFSSHIEQRHGPDAPLMTKAMREREEARLGLKKKEYNESRIRIRFSDRTQLEATFASSETIPSLYTFLRAHLDKGFAQTTFTLYQTPPKCDYPETPNDVKSKKLAGKTLKELGMAPQAAFNIRWDKAEMNANTFPAPLASDVKSKAEPLPSPPVFDASQAPQGEAGSSSGGSKPEGEAKKIPKWLKSLQKK